MEKEPRISAVAPFRRLNGGGVYSPPLPLPGDADAGWLGAPGAVAVPFPDATNICAAAALTPCRFCKLRDCGWRDDGAVVFLCFTS